MDPGTERDIVAPRPGRAQPARADRARIGATGARVAGSARTRGRAMGSSVSSSVSPGIHRGPLRLLARTISRAWGDRILGLSAEAAFWQLLSLPSLFLAVLGSLGYFGGFLGPATLDSIERQLIEVFSGAFTPGVIDELIAPTLEDVLRDGRLEVVSIGFLLSLWAGSSSMATFVNTITIAYDQRDVRGAVRSRLLALRIYLAFVLLAVLTLPLLVLGPGLLLGLVPLELRDTARVLVTAVYWPFLLLLLVIALASLYRMVLPRKPRWIRQLPGAILAVTIFVLGGILMREYVTYVLIRQLSYGALAAPIAALLFLFLIGLAVIFGAELNATIEQLWPARPTRRERRRLAREAMHAERTGVPLLVL